MLASILKVENGSRDDKFGYYFAKVMSKLNYSKFSHGMEKVYNEQSKTHVIVLMEYVNSTYDTTIAEIERLPGTTMSIDTFLNKPETLSTLRKLFVSDYKMYIYTRRKIEYIPSEGEEHTTRLTKYKQLVLKILPAAPSPISSNSQDDYNELDIAHLDL